MRRVPNLTLRREDGRVVAESVTVADSTMRRLRGLLGKRDLPSGYGVLLRPAWSIHTAFMRFPIDVVFLDPDQVVIKIMPNLTPFSTASCRGAREIVELGPASASDAGWRSATVSPGPPERPTRRRNGPSAKQTSSPSGAGPSCSRASTSGISSSSASCSTGRGSRSSRACTPEGVADAVGGEQADVAVIDADAVGEGLRLANITRARRPETAVVLVGDNLPEHPPTGLRVYRKWDETDGVVAAIEDALEQKVV